MQKFCKGGGEGRELGIFKKEGVQLQEHQGERWKTMLKI